MSQIFNIVEELEKERKKNKELEELCDKYEEEHKTTFEKWKKDIKRINKAIEYIEHLDNVFIDSKEQDNIVDILKGDNK